MNKLITKKNHLLIGIFYIFNVSDENSKWYEYIFYYICFINKVFCIWLMFMILLNIIYKWHCNSCLRYKI